jgi:uncharacterized protein (DUF1800 family)
MKVFARKITAALTLLAAILSAPAIAYDEVIRISFEDRPAEGPFTKGEAARFLNQATFGANLPEINRLLSMGYNAWLDEQFAATPSLELPYVLNLINAQVAAGQQVDVFQDRRVEIFFKNALAQPDQLRQRMAWALSQITVVSDNNGALEGIPTTLADYYDKLAQGAFANYRTLLGQVTLHPAMGNYLSMIRNRKEDAALNIRPDENYAREIMQLFSVGLVMLNLDGSATATPSYNQQTIQGLARVFTGWSYSTCTPPNGVATAPGFNSYDWTYCYAGSNSPANQDYRLYAGWMNPMKAWGEGTAFGSIYHETGSKQLLNYPGVSLPSGLLAAGGTATSDLNAALDNVFNHPNVGPFLAKRLIQRFTTSNPSPAYVQAVASAFNGSGFGSTGRGDLKATVRAILMHPEARRPSIVSAGKLREPVLRVTNLWRAVDYQLPQINGVGMTRILENGMDGYAAQAPMRSPTVFNFYLPGFQLPGPVTTAGLVSPEFQITTDTYITRLTNEIGGKIYYGYVGNPYIYQPYPPVQINLTRDLADVQNLDALLDRFSVLFLNGRMSPYMYNRLKTHMNGIGVNSSEGWARERVQDALYLILTSPEYVVEK